jgi:hypothetical protein
MIFQNFGKNKPNEIGKFSDSNILRNSSKVEKILENKSCISSEKKIPDDECFSKQIPKTFKTPKLKGNLDNKYQSEEINLLKPSEECRFLRDQKNLSSTTYSTFFVEKLADEPGISDKVNKLEKLIPNEMKESILFNKFKKMKFNADLIISHKMTKGEIYLGSNSYKYNVENLYNFDVIINVIGEDPIKTFIDKRVKFTNIHQTEKCQIEEMTAVLENGHSVRFYIKKNENFHDYHFLADTIHMNFLQGKKILVHCKEGLMRSATLLTFYLRKFIFNKVEFANEFISIKRENASCIKMFLPTIEKILL